MNTGWSIRRSVADFRAGNHLHSTIDDIDLVELCVADMTAHIHRVGIAAHLRLRLADGCRHLGIGGRALIKYFKSLLF